ncbi:MAG TPA: DUF2357 domain-containing protein, partial [Chitinophagaceae bacterium]|nr:DUF2357 domain-containing protein [Chitinophagaceae bacterium]
MTTDKLSIPILLENKATVTICIEASSTKGILEEISFLDAKEHGEAAIQLMEGYSYEYEITEGYSLQPSGVVFPFKMKKNGGHIKPRNYVGTLSIPIIDLGRSKRCGILQLEVRSSRKLDYRTDYRVMLEDIAEKCVELLMQHSIPAYQHFTVKFNDDVKALYQRFAFIKGILDTVEFNDAIHKVLLNPVTNWKEEEIEKDARAIKKLNNKMLRQIVSGHNRMRLPKQHALNDKLSSIPQKLKIVRKRETTDTSENRFIKYALSHFLYYCSNFGEKLKAHNVHKYEVAALEEKINHWL